MVVFVEEVIVVVVVEMLVITVVVLDAGVDSKGWQGDESVLVVELEVTQVVVIVENIGEYGDLTIRLYRPGLLEQRKRGELESSGRMHLTAPYFNSREVRNIL
jgi:hypothetical protein